MLKRPATIKGALLRGLIGIVLIIVNFESGRYIFAILGGLFLVWMVVGLIRHRHNAGEAPSTDNRTATRGRQSSRR
jgi:threonine/homoserine/homoserine lactone efflux protein